MFLFHDVEHCLSLLSFCVKAQTVKKDKGFKRTLSRTIKSQTKVCMRKKFEAMKMELILN